MITEEESSKCIFKFYHNDSSLRHLTRNLKENFEIWVYSHCIRNKSLITSISRFKSEEKNQTTRCHQGLNRQRNYRIMTLKWCHFATVIRPPSSFFIFPQIFRKRWRWSESILWSQWSKSIFRMNTANPRGDVFAYKYSGNMLFICAFCTWFLYTMSKHLIVPCVRACPFCSLPG